MIAPCAVLCLVIQLCITLCDPMDCSPPGSSIHGDSEYWNVLPCSPSGDLPNSGTEPRSPTLQVDSLPSEPLGKPQILEWVAYPFSRGTFWPRNWTRVSCIANGFFTSRTTREALDNSVVVALIKCHRMLHLYIHSILLNNNKGYEKWISRSLFKATLTLKVLMQWCP